MNWVSATRVAALGLLALALAGCADRKAPVAMPSPPPPPEPTQITLEPSDVEAFIGALKDATGRPPNQDIGWSNPATGRTGSVRILRVGFDGTNRTCREFAAAINQGKLFQHQTGITCRQADGSWEIVNTQEYPVHKRPS